MRVSVNLKTRLPNSFSFVSLGLKTIWNLESSSNPHHLSAHLVHSRRPVASKRQFLIQSLVPGFKFNLGFSGKYFHHGIAEENLGDDMLLENVDKCVYPLPRYEDFVRYLYLPFHAVLVSIIVRKSGSVAFHSTSSRYARACYVFQRIRRYFRGNESRGRFAFSRGEKGNEIVGELACKSGSKRSEKGFPVEVN